jgi:hypothetical protein
MVRQWLARRARNSDQNAEKKTKKMASAEHWPPNQLEMTVKSGLIPEF